MVDSLTLALAASVVFGVRDVLLRKILLRTEAIFATYINIVAGIPFLALVSYGLGDFERQISLTPYPMLVITATGIIRLVVARTSYFGSIKAIGASRASSLASTNLIFSMALSTLVLGEAFTINHALGVALMIVAVIIISSSLGAHVGHFEPGKGILLGAVSAAAFGSPPILFKSVARSFPSAIFANLVAYVTGWLVYSLVLLTMRRRLIDRGARSSIPMIALSGVLTAAALSMGYTALVAAASMPVLIILNASPVFTLLLSYAIIRSAERLNLSSVVAVALGSLGVYFAFAS